MKIVFMGTPGVAVEALPDMRLRLWSLSRINLREGAKDCSLRR